MCIHTERQRDRETERASPKGEVPSCRVYQTQWPRTKVQPKTPRPTAHGARTNNKGQRPMAQAQWPKPQGLRVRICTFSICICVRYSVHVCVFVVYERIQWRERDRVRGRGILRSQTPWPRPNGPGAMAEAT